MKEVGGYLYNSKGHDEEISLDEIEVDSLKENQPLWVNVRRRDEALLSKSLSSG